MKYNLLRATRIEWAAGFGLLMGLFLTVWVYHYGWSAATMFDDGPNLDPIASVYSVGPWDSEAGVQFVLSGQAGPTGRPIALASFLIDGYAWPGDSGHLYYTNTLIHALNGTLVAWLAFLLARALQLSGQKSTLLAVAAALIWASMPLLSTTTLLIVQRMALLSATFVFLAIVIYLKCRSFSRAQPLLAAVYAIGGVGGCAIFGVFSKESAAIIPFLLFVLEKTVFADERRFATGKIWQAVKWILVYIPSVALFAYLVRAGFEGFSSLGTVREFGSLERLVAQSVILWDYARLSMFPVSSDLGVFNDDLTGATMASRWVVLAGLAAWVVVFWLALRFRHVSSVPLFVVGWFCASHLLESSVISIEMYFQHRNYIATVGIAFGMAWMALLIADKIKRKWVGPGLIGLYLLANLLVLLQTTTLMGDRRLAAGVWFDEHPGSPRAAQHLSQELVASGEYSAALRVIDRAAEKNPREPVLRLQGLQLACAMNLSTAEDVESRFRNTLYRFQFGQNSYAIPDALAKIAEASGSGVCGEVIGQAELIWLAEAALSNEKVNSQAQNVANIELFIATRYIELGDLSGTMRHLENALEAKPETATVGLAVGVLRSAGLERMAEEFKQTYQCEMQPRNITQTGLQSVGLIERPCGR